MLEQSCKNMTVQTTLDTINLFGYTVDVDFIEDTLYCKIPEVQQEKPEKPHFHAQGEFSSIVRLQLEV